MLLHKINNSLETLKFTVIFTKPISGWITIAKNDTGCYVSVLTTRKTLTSYLRDL